MKEKDDKERKGKEEGPKLSSAFGSATKERQLWIFLQFINIETDPDAAPICLFKLSENSEKGRENDKIRSS